MVSVEMAANGFAGEFLIDMDEREEPQLLPMVPTAKLPRLEEVGVIVFMDVVPVR